MSGFVQKPAVILLLASAVTFGAVIQINSPSALGPNAALSWDKVGTAGDTFSGSLASTAGSVGVTVASPQLQRVDESFLWVGSFILNDFLLSNVDNGSAVTVTFNQAVRGAGAFVQGDVFGPYTVTVTVFSFATNLGSFTVSGNNSGQEDGSAPFLGVLSSAANITSLVFTEIDAAGINELALDTLQVVTAAPEPSVCRLVWILVGFNLTLLMVRRHKDIYQTFVTFLIKRFDA